MSLVEISDKLYRLVKGQRVIQLVLSWGWSFDSGEQPTSKELEEGWLWYYSPEKTCRFLLCPADSEEEHISPGTADWCVREMAKYKKVPPLKILGMLSSQDAVMKVLEEELGVEYSYVEAVDRLNFRAKELCPDYPWEGKQQQPFDSLWALCSSLEGVEKACDDLHAIIRRKCEQIKALGGEPEDGFKEWENFIHPLEKEVADLKKRMYESDVKIGRLRAAARQSPGCLLWLAEYYGKDYFTNLKTDQELHPL